MSLLRLKTLALALTMTAAVQARADSVQFSGFAHGSETVNYSLTAPNTAVSGSAAAGGFSTTLNSGSSFTSYCVDLYQTIAFGAPAYTDYVPVGNGHVFANADAYTDLGLLYGFASLVNNAVSEAAFQIAVWEIAYETASTYNLASGAATFSGGTAASSGALSLAASWLGALDGNPGAGIGVLESRGHQDVIYAPIPEPSTTVMIVAGMLGMSFVARRRRKAA